MNYKESKMILDKIKNSENILINCHRGPDLDSIGSALAMYEVLSSMGKTVRVVCSTKIEKINLTGLLPDLDKIEIVDFSKIDYSKYDLFIALDSSDWDMISNLSENPPTNIEIAVIDHHKTNTRFGDINLIDYNVTSVGELLYRVFEDWGTKLSSSIANSLLTAIIGDTGAFGYPGATKDTFEVVSDLIEKGGRKDEIIQRIYRSVDFNLVKFWGEVLSRLEIDKKYKFVWSCIPFKIFEKYGSMTESKESAASLFAQSVGGTNFGFIAVEQKPKELGISFRSRSGFDTSKIALALGGGGHVYASGASIKGLSFEKAVEKLLEAVRKFASNE